MNEQRRPLEGQVVLITGAARRIGRAVALALAADGADVVLNVRRSVAEADAVAAEVGSLGSRALVHAADVTLESEVATMFGTLCDRFGRLDMLVNNAADRRQSPLGEMTLVEWRSITGTILDGAFLCTRAALPLLRIRGGTIVNIGGMTAHVGAANRAHVCAAKAGLVGLTKAIAVECGSDGITANCVVPGRIGGVRAATAGEAPQTPGERRPLVGREGTPEDVAAMVRHLCLPGGRYLTGQTLHVNGGLYLP
jgi:3-oxoacyl-[acyl-carrier protein] reductase